MRGQADETMRKCWSGRVVAGCDMALWSQQQAEQMDPVDGMVWRGSDGPASPAAEACHGQMQSDLPHRHSGRVFGDFHFTGR